MPKDNTPQARAATVARVEANDPQVTVVNWGLCTAVKVTDAEVQALAAKLAGNTHVLEIALYGADELTDAGARALREALPRCAVRLAKLHSCGGVSAALRAEVITAGLEKLLALVRADDPGLTELDFWDMGLMDAHVAMVAGALLRWPETRTSSRSTSAATTT